MRKHLPFGILLLLAGISMNAQQSDFPKLAGPYLGQKPPGRTPEAFAPKIFDFKKAYFHTSVSFSPDGKEVYWSQDNTNRRANPNDPIIKGICVSKLENGHWTTPKLASFSGISILDYAPVISTDGKKLYFISIPFEKQGKSGKETIWIVDKTPEGWSVPKPLPSAINSIERIHRGISVNNQGNIYFGANNESSPDIRSYPSIYYSKNEKGEYQESERLDPTINKSGVSNDCPFISPDGSYLIFTRGGNNADRLFISFRNKAGSWSQPKGINSVIEMNEDHRQICPYVSPDGKYFFFLDIVGDGINKRIDSRFYWVDAGFIEELRTKK